MKIFFAMLALVSLNAFAEPKLIHGEEAPAGMFPFVVNIGGCTGTKVGPRHFIYAGHCVFSGPGTYRAPSQVTVTAANLASPTTHRFRVVALNLHETWLENCRNQTCTGHETGSTRNSPGKVDLALIQVAEDSPEIPWIAIDFTPIAPGTPVTLAGYGCTRGISMGGSGGRLRYGRTTSGDFSLLKHEGSLYAPVAERTAKSNIITPATRLDPTAPALCPGDSGGPLLVEHAGEWKIAGIAGDYTFRGEYEAWGAVPVTNLHTRLDDESLHHVGAWIRAHW